MKRTLTFLVAVAILVSAVPAFAGRVLAEIEYFYSDDGFQAITSSADDKKAFDWAFSHRNDNYNPFPTATLNQCMTFAMGVLDAGGVSYTYPESPVYGPFEGCTCTPNDFMRINCFNSNFIWMKGKLE